MRLVTSPAAVPPPPARQFRLLNEALHQMLMGLAVIATVKT